MKEFYDLVKIAGIGILVSLIATLIGQTGRKDQAELFTLMGFLVVMMMVVGLMSKFFYVVTTTFAR